MKQSIKPNILIIGRSGGGKSELINYLADNKLLAETGVGKPITQSYNKYPLTLLDGFSINLIDSQGLEVKSFSTQKNEVVNYISNNKKSGFSNWIHTIFYCISLDTTRFEDAEIELTNWIQSKTDIKIAFIITNCKNYYGNDVKEMTAYIRNILGKEVLVFPVNSDIKTTMKGEFLEVGKEPLYRNLRTVIWNSIRNQIINEYVDSMHDYLIKYICSLCEGYKKQIDTMFAQKKIPRFDDRNITTVKNRIEKYVMNKNDEFRSYILDLKKMYNVDSFPIEYVNLQKPSISIFDSNHFINMVKMIEKPNDDRNILTKSKMVINQYKSRKDFLNNIVSDYKNRLDIIFNLFVEIVPDKKMIHKDMDLLFDSFRDLINQHTPYKRLYTKVNSNEKCPCRSGKKFKDCCKGNGLFD